MCALQTHKPTNCVLFRATMEAVFSCMTSSGCQEKGVHQVAIPKKSSQAKRLATQGTTSSCVHTLFMITARKFKKLAQELPASTFSAEVARPLWIKKCCTSVRPAEPQCPAANLGSLLHLLEVSTNSRVNNPTSSQDPLTQNQLQKAG